MKVIVIACICLGTLFWSDFAFAEEPGFKIIVNASNPSEALSAKEISKLFLKKVTKWKEGGEKAEPVDLIDDLEIREDFSKVIHGRKVSSIKSYWQKKIFSGRGVPPLEAESEQKVLEFVAKNNGAIGYVSEAANIDAYELKVLRVEN